MKVVPFIADTPAAALAKIQQELGPEAVVLSVRPLPATGLARLWQKNRAIEVLAGVADDSDTVEDRPVKTNQRNSPPPQPATSRWQFLPEEQVQSRAAFPDAPPRTWRAVGRLEAMGLLPVFADRLQDRLRTCFGSQPPIDSEEEWARIQAVLGDYWRPAESSNVNDHRPHVFIGPPGSGKTTLLCKWLVSAILVEERRARIWRLDGASANTAEILNIYGEMFGFGVERFWQQPAEEGELLLVDLPGVEISDEDGMAALKDQLAALPGARVHLALNAAYDTPILFDQLRAFARFQPEDLSFTHLDEEARASKLWNFVLGTNCILRFLSAGQKIPGQFSLAQPQLLFAGVSRPSTKGLRALQPAGSP